MLKLAGDLRLAEEAGQGHRVLQQFAVQFLERNIAVQVHIARDPDPPHSSLTMDSQSNVAPFGSRRRCNGRLWYFATNALCRRLIRWGLGSHRTPPLSHGRRSW